MGLSFIAFVLAVGSLLWLRKLSNKIDRLERRLDAALPDSKAPAPTASRGSGRGESGFGTSILGNARRHLAQLGWPSENPLRALAGSRGSSTPDAGGSGPGWMVWLGGISVGLAGVFVVKYSIDEDLLTPWTRVALATFLGLCMHVLAEWLVRRTGRTHPAFSALAAAGSVTLCATVLAALHLYELVPPLAAFGFLAFVSIGTVALALRHGPVFAALGMVGSYAVPLLVGGDGGQILGVLGYALIASATVLMVIRYLYRRWLWWGMFAGSAFWWLSSLGLVGAHGYRGLYLALLARAMLWLPSFDWLRARTGPTAIPEGLEGGVRPALVAILIAQGISIGTEPFSITSALGWMPLVIVVFLAIRADRPWWAFPWALLAIQSVAWIGTALQAGESGIEWRAVDPDVRSGFPAIAAWMATVYVGFSIWRGRSFPAAAPSTALAVASPVCWLAVAFIVATDRAPSGEWTLVAASLGVLYWIAGRKLFRDGRVAGASWTILGAASAYSLAAAMAFREAGLTLALAVQAIPLAWLAVRHRSPNVEWAVKGVLGAVVLRLTLNPWLPGYPEESHWIWWTYGGATLSCFVASRCAVPLPALRRWIEAAAAHLLVLSCWLATRDLLYDGAVFSKDYSLQEAAINGAAWAALGLAYHWRAGASEHVAAIYRWASRVMLSMALANYVVVLLPLNPLWGGDPVGETPVWNLLLLAFGAPVALAWLVGRLHEPATAAVAGKVAPLALFVFVSLEIRHLWQGRLDVAIPTGDGEMATYSVVWLCMAVPAVLAGEMRGRRGVYRAGMALLVLTACKVFLVDMAGLTGLLRAGSFLGLGLSLLGLAYLHQRLGRSNSPPDARLP